MSFKILLFYKQGHLSYYAKDIQENDIDDFSALFCFALEHIFLILYNTFFILFCIKAYIFYTKQILLSILVCIRAYIFDIKQILFLLPLPSEKPLLIHSARNVKKLKCFTFNWTNLETRDADPGWMRIRVSGLDEDPGWMRIRVG